MSFWHELGARTAMAHLKVAATSPGTTALSTAAKPNAAEHKATGTGGAGFKPPQDPLKRPPPPVPKLGKPLPTPPSAMQVGA